MITCPVCGAANGDFADVCTGCKGFLQSKIETLDLFHTFWGLIEAPRRAMRRVALARHKNYVVLLSGLLGIAIAFAVLWRVQAGRHLPGLIAVLGIGVAGGSVLGLVLVPALGALASLLARALGGRPVVRNMRATTAYAGMPIVFSLVLVFPLEIALFGQYLFDGNPPPVILNPAAWWILAALDGAAVLWAFGLLAVGVSVAAETTRARGALVAALIAAAAAAPWVLA